MTSKSSRINVSEILPDDDEILSQNLRFRKLLAKYSAPEKNNDDTGFALDDALERYIAEGDDEDSSLASEVVSDEDDAAETDPAYDYEDVRKQRTLVMKERSEQWEKNGLSMILNDVGFKLNITFVDDWLKRNWPNKSNQVAIAREARITKQDGDTTLDMHNKSNITIRNDENQQSLATVTSSNYEVSGSNTKVVIHQIEKTTLTTIFSNGLNDASFSLKNFAGKSVDLQGLSTFASFKIPDPLSELRCISMKAPEPKVLAEMDVAQAANSVRKANIGSRNIIGVDKRDVRQPVNKPYLAVKKLAKTKTAKTLPSSSSKEENKSSSEQHCMYGRRGRTSRKLRISSSDDYSDENVQTPLNQQHLVNGIIKKSCLRSSKSKSKVDECVPRPKESNNQPIKQHIKSQTAKKKVSILISSSSDECDSILNSSSSDECDKPSHTSAKSRTQQKFHPKSHDKICKKPAVPAQSEKYIMSLECQKQLTKGGRLRHNIEGTVIYRPRHIQPDLPKDAKKIEITKQDLDLSAVISESKRRKFDDFKRRIHPNSSVVYYMSDSEEDKTNEDDEVSDEDDDILFSFCPIVVYEYAYQGV